MQKLEETGEIEVIREEKCLEMIEVIQAYAVEVKSFFLKMRPKWLIQNNKDWNSN